MALVLRVDPEVCHHSIRVYRFPALPGGFPRSGPVHTFVEVFAFMVEIHRLALSLLALILSD